VGDFFTEPDTSSSGRTARSEGGACLDFRYPYFIGYFENIFTFREFDLPYNIAEYPWFLRAQKNG
jgi:hypothetical protein